VALEIKNHPDAQSARHFSD